MEDRSALQKLLDSSSRTVFFGGAGVSTGSLIPDFRGKNGLFQETFEGLTPEMILSASFFYLHPESFFEYLRKFLIHPEAKPNAAHLKLAEMEKENCLAAVVTQNIDGLHQKAGSRAVFPIHGNLEDVVCIECGRRGSLAQIIETEGIPRCRDCGGILRPEITLYGEAPDPVVMRGACREISRCDTLIVGGTSLTVEPAASCLSYFHGRALVLINETPTPKDEETTILIREPIEEVLAEIEVHPRPAPPRTAWYS